jgi:hypothetical protein
MTFQWSGHFDDNCLTSVKTPVFIYFSSPYNRDMSIIRNLVASEWIKALYCQWPKPLELWYIQEIIGLK